MVPPGAKFTRSVVVTCAGAVRSAPNAGSLAPSKINSNDIVAILRIMSVLRYRVEPVGCAPAAPGGCIFAPAHGSSLRRAGGSHLRESDLCQSQPLKHRRE